MQGGFFVKKPSFIRSQLLTFIQLAICLIAVIAALVIKAVGGDIHAAVGTWFFENLNNSIFTDTADSSVNFTENTSLTETSRSFEETKP